MMELLKNVFKNVVAKIEISQFLPVGLRHSNSKSCTATSELHKTMRTLKSNTNKAWKQELIWLTRTQLQRSGGEGGWSVMCDVPPGTRWRVSDESLHLLEWDFRSQPFVLLFDRAYNWTCQRQFNMMHLFTNSSSGLINHLADPCDAPPPPLQPYLTVGVCVHVCAVATLCVCVCLLCAVDFVYLWPLQPRRSARVIWAGGDHRYWLTFGAAARWGRCEFLNKHTRAGEVGGLPTRLLAHPHIHRWPLHGCSGSGDLILCYYRDIIISCNRLPCVWGFLRNIIFF